jgi:hypothetical protein
MTFAHKSIQYSIVTCWKTLQIEDEVLERNCEENLTSIIFKNNNTYFEDPACFQRD